MRVLETAETDRRSLLAGFAALMIGVNAPALAWTVETSARFFTDPELTFLSQLSDTLVPDTDTPGAVKAGVPQAFDAMMITWASPAHRGALRAVLLSLGAQLDELAGGDFASAARKVRTAALSQVDAAAFGAGRAQFSDFREIKSLIVRLYYTSEIGASQELRYDPVPGEWLNDIAFKDVGKAWAT